MQELFPGKYQPTLAHRFIKLLHDKGLLLRCYTQNIDSLETLAGVPRSKLVAAHGNFDSASCVNAKCKRSVNVLTMKAAIDEGNVRIVQVVM